MENQIIIKKRPFIKYSYIIILFFLLLTGFGQMPIFKRYYIADIPGLSWLAEFFITHFIHYIGAALFIGLSLYMIVEYLLFRRNEVRITVTGFIRGLILAGIILTGVLLVVRNLPGYWFSPNIITLLDLLHLGLVLLFLIVAGLCLIFKKKWIYLLSK